MRGKTAAEIYENGEKKETFEPVLSGKGCDKATGFHSFLRRLPTFLYCTLVNVKGYKAKCAAREGSPRQPAVLPTLTPMPAFLKGNR